MPPYKDRREKYIDNLKLHGKFDDFKKKRAALEKNRRLRLKEALAKMSVAKRTQVVEENRIKNRKGVQKFRLWKKELELRSKIEPSSLENNEIPENQLPKSHTNETQQEEALKSPKQNCKNQKSSVTFTENCQNQAKPIPPNNSIEFTTVENNEMTKNPQPDTPATENPKGNDSLTKNCKHQPTTSLSSDICHNQPSSSKNCQNQPSTKNSDKPLVASTSTSTSLTGTRQHKEPLVTKAITFEHSYKTSSALSKAEAKTKKTLPSSPSKRKAVIARLLRTFSEEDQRDIIGIHTSTGSKTNKGLSYDWIEKIRLFYERDDISRISPNVKDSRKFVDPDTGEKVVRQIRHLNYKLSEVYDIFVEDLTDNNESDRPPVKLSKFCALRPEHVFLMSETPHNVCFCLYHTNFIQCAESLHKHIPELPDDVNHELTELLVCDVPTRQCYFKTCKECSRSKTDEKIKLIAKSTPNKSKTVKWMKWSKDESANRFQNCVEEGSVNELVAYFLSIYPKFLIHSYVKREQAKAFIADRKRVNSDQHLDEAVLQIDFAENFKCECQDEVQQAHYNQKQISLFTTALHHANLTKSKVIASDNTHHAKETLVAYLYTIFKDLPSTVKTVRVWSDGPSNQFKNKYIAAVISLFQDTFGVKIIWNFFATGHGKSCIDGIGAAVKSKVKEMVLAREVIVNNTKDFVDAFNRKKSKVGLVELTDTDIDRINELLQLNELFSKAPAVRDISKFHKLVSVNNKIKGFIVSADD